MKLFALCLILFTFFVGIRTECDDSVYETGPEVEVISPGLIRVRWIGLERDEDCMALSRLRVWPKNEPEKAKKTAFNESWFGLRVIVEPGVSYALQMETDVVGRGTEDNIIAPIVEFKAEEEKNAAINLAKKKQHLNKVFMGLALVRIFV